MNPALRRTLPLIATGSIAGALLSACYVVPIDHRTGRPVPYEGPSAPVVVLPPAPAPATPMVIAPPAATALQARLYPLNPEANTGGLLTAQVVDNHTGRGSITLAYRGALLQGEATRVDGGHGFYGRIHRDVLGPSATPTSGRRGIANAYGANGIHAQCEYVITGAAIGTGACLFSDGAKYQMHFGQ